VTLGLVPASNQAGKQVAGEACGGNSPPATAGAQQKGKVESSVMQDNKDTAVHLQSPVPAKPSASISSRTRVAFGALSHSGKVRPNNEDSFLVTRFKRSMNTLLTNLPQGEIPDQYVEAGYVMLVADGIGGRTAGEIASRTAISALVDLVIQTPDWIMRPDREGIEEVLRRMKERFDQLTDVLTRRAQSSLQLYGMGTTLTLAVSLGADLVIAHVGASRAYLFRGGQLLRLTSDQTVAQLLADAGVIKREDVSKHHARHVLTDSITAAGEKAAVELQHVRLADGDQFLLCSDGLTNMVTDKTITTVLEKTGAAADACRTLVDLALDAGGKDNVTVVLGRYEIPADVV
jgi:serine/threonine protein phosphatase PrpC